jgi:hypothetical protein
MPSVPSAGTSPASAYELQDYTPQLPPPAILADLIDPLTGEYASLLTSANLADAMVIEAVRIERGSGAAVRDLGNRFAEITHVDGSGPEVVESMARQALDPAREAGVVELVRVTVTPNADDPSELDTVLEYRDLLAARDAENRSFTLKK